MTSINRRSASIGVTALLSLLVSIMPLAALADHHTPEDWLSTPGAVECIRHEADSEHGQMEPDPATATEIFLNPYSDEWVGDRYVVLVINNADGDPAGDAVYDFPVGNTSYQAVEVQGQTDPIDYWIICLGLSPNSVPVADPTWSVTPETAVCDPESQEYIGQSDGSITLDPGEDYIWQHPNLEFTDLAAGTYGPFIADASEGRHFASNNDTRFSTGDVVVDQLIQRDPDCEDLVTAEPPELVDPQECGVPASLIVPETEGVIYLLDGTDVSGQTLEGPLSGTIVAEAAPGFGLSEPFSFEFDLAAAEECPPATDDTTSSTVDPETDDDSDSTPDSDTEATTRSTLPNTGSDTDALVWVAGLALMSGAGLVLLTRRHLRRSAD